MEVKDMYFLNKITRLLFIQGDGRNISPLCSVHSQKAAKKQKANGTFFAETKLDPSVEKPESAQKRAQKNGITNTAFEAEANGKEVGRCCRLWTTTAALRAWTVPVFVLLTTRELVI